MNFVFVVVKMFPLLLIGLKGKDDGEGHGELGAGKGEGGGNPEQLLTVGATDGTGNRK